MEHAEVKIEEQIALLNGEKKVDFINARSKELSISNPRKALALAEEAYELSSRLEYKRGLGYSLLNMGYAGRTLSSYVEYLPKLVEAMEIFKLIEDSEGLMRVYNLMGISYFYFAKYEQALGLFKKGLGLSYDLQDTKLQSSILNNIGEIHRELENYDDAMEYYTKALSISEEIGDNINISVILMNLGHIHNCMKNYSEALDYYNKSIAISEEIKDFVSKGEALCKKGEIYEKMGRVEEAMMLYQQSLEVLENHGNSFYQIDTLINLGSLNFKLDKPSLAEEYLERAVKSAKKISASKKLYAAHLALAQCYEKQGNYKKAIKHYKLYYMLEKRVTTDNIEEKLRVMTVEFKLEQARKEAEIYQLKNIELREKNQEIENKAKLLAIANERLEYLSTIDELTGIPNRRVFNRVIKKEWANCLKEAIPLSVIIIDVDFFKQYNDSYGHLQGDECLRQVAGALKKVLNGTSDFIGRFGGEEFGIILPGTGYE